MIKEVVAELRELVSGRVAIADGILPPIVFVAFNALFGVPVAAATGIGTAAAITAWRLWRGRPIRFALAGLLGTLIAALLALRSGAARDYFLPGIISGVVTTSVALISVLVRRPLVGWASWITRGWPSGWFWHPQVRPAYTRATLIWVGFFATRTFLQWRLFVDGEVEALGLVRVILGWPGLLALLVVTYVLGRKWLGELAGPSVDEFESDARPPWQGQQAGF